MLEDTCTPVEGGRLNGYVRGHQHPVVRGEAGGQC